MNPYLIAACVSLGVGFMGKSVEKRFDLSASSYLYFSALSFIVALILHVEIQNNILDMFIFLPFVSRSKIISSTIGLCIITFLLILLKEYRKKSSKALEKDGFFWKKCNESFGKLNAFGEHIIGDLKRGKDVKIGLTEADIKIFEGFMPFLSEESILSYSTTKGGTIGGPLGPTRTHIISPLARFDSIVKNPSFEIQSCWIKLYDKLIKR